MTTQEETEALEAARRVLAVLEVGNDPPNGEDVERVCRALLSSSKAARGMREALAFYAEERRYHGPNQNNPGGDPHTPDDAPYLTDVTRDGGSRARAALTADPEK